MMLEKYNIFIGDVLLEKADDLVGKKLITKNLKFLTIEKIEEIYADKVFVIIEGHLKPFKLDNDTQKDINNLRFIEKPLQAQENNLHKQQDPEYIQMIRNQKKRILSYLWSRNVTSLYHFTAFENTPFLDNQEGMVVIGRFLYRYSGTVPDHTQLTIPGGVEVISHRAFENQTGLTSVVIPSTVTTIEHSAFKNASALNRVTFEEGSHLKTIKDQAFFGTRALKSITLPASLEVIGPAAFAHADGLTTVRFEQESQLKAIHSNAFYEATALSEIELPHGVRTLGTGAFRNNKALEVIYIPATVEIIGFEAFKGCDALTITTAHQTAPIGWHSKWHAGDSPVDWGQ